MVMVQISPFVPDVAVQPDQYWKNEFASGVTVSVTC